jgi:hypothetical protein
LFLPKRFIKVNLQADMQNAQCRQARALFFLHLELEPLMHLLQEFIKKYPVFDFLLHTHILIVSKKLNKYLFLIPTNKQQPYEIIVCLDIFDHRGGPSI